MLLSSLVYEKAAYDMNSINAGSRCFDGTRENLQREIMRWFQTLERKPSSIFWLNGIAGIGKSTVARTIAAQVDSLHQLGASFFFSRTNGIINPKSLFTTVAIQLTRFSQDIKKEIAGALEKDPDSGERMIHLQLQKLIIDPLLRLRDPPSRLLLVIDALDECVEDGAKEILQSLLSLTPKIPFLKILVTSRPEQHIEMAFMEGGRQAGLVTENLNDSVAQEEIKLYLRHCFDVIHQRWPEFQWTEEELDEIARRAGVFFVYISTVREFIGDPYVGDPRGQLDILLNAKTADDLSDDDGSPYHFLDDLYFHVVQNAMPSSKRKKLLKRYQAVVGTIVTMFDPLPIESLAKLLDLGTNNVKSALTYLPSIISLPNLNEERPLIYHPSFPDFITDPKRCKDLDLVIIPKEHHRRLVIQCLTHMMKQLKRDICDIRDPSKLNSEVENLQERVEVAIPPWVRYAMLHWGSHLEKTPYGDAETKEHLELFCMKSLLHWVEALSVLGQLKIAIPLLVGVHTWAVSIKLQSFISIDFYLPFIVPQISSESSPLVLSLLYDTQRMLQAHSPTISSSALHLYHSVLPFLPAQCKLYEVYENEVVGCVRVVKGREHNWNPCLTTLRGHSGEVFSVAFSPTGKQVGTASWDKTGRIWDPSDGSHVVTLEGHSLSVNSIKFSPNGTYVATGSDDQTARLWNPTDGKHTLTLRGHSKGVTSVAFSPDSGYVATGSDDHTARIWTTDQGDQVVALVGHSGSVTSLDFSPKSEQIATGSRDHTARVWDLADGKHVLTLLGHSDIVWSVTYSPNGMRIATASADETARVWDSLDGKHVLTLQGHSSSVRSVAFSADSECILTGSKDHTSRVWSSVDAKHIMTREGHVYGVSSVTFSPDGQLFATGSYDKTARIWDPTDGKEVVKLESRCTEVMGVAFSPDGKLIATAFGDGTGGIWNVADGHFMLTLESSGITVMQGMAFSPNGQCIGAGIGSKAQVWDSVHGKVILTLYGNSGIISLVAFSPDGKHIATGGDDHSVQLWDSTYGKRVRTFNCSGPVFELHFSQDSAFVLALTLHRWLKFALSPRPSHIKTAVPVKAEIQTPDSPYHVEGHWVLRLTRKDSRVMRRRICKLPSALGMCVNRSNGDNVVIGGENGEVVILDLSGTHNVIQEGSLPLI